MAGRWVVASALAQSGGWWEWQMAGGLVIAGALAQSRGLVGTANGRRMGLCQCVSTEQGIGGNGKWQWQMASGRDGG
jgi:hypothetical protein